MVFVNNLDPVLFELGALSIRWYGVFFGLGVAVAYIVAYSAFKRGNFPIRHLDSVAIYLFFGLIIGARLGHIIFYNFDYFSQNPIDIFKIWKGGLASHGAALGLLIAYLIWINVKKIKFSKYADVLILGMPFVAGMVRIGNFFNSEIIGKPTGGDWGVVFARLSDTIPRHPTQIYEALSNFIIFGILLFVYYRFYKKTPPLFLLFLYAGLYFVSRFVVEFWKEKHVLSDDYFLSMGQILSIPPVLLVISFFIFLFYRYLKREA